MTEERHEVEPKHIKDFEVVLETRMHPMNWGTALRELKHGRMVARMGWNGKNMFLTSNEVANYLSVESKLINQWAESGRLPAERRGSDWQFEKAKVDEWIANGRIG